MARLAALSERVLVGPAVLLLPLYDPAILSKQLAELDRGRGGRIAVGIGVGGEYPLELTGCGVSLHDRGPRTDEAVDLMRALWMDRRGNHESRYWPALDATVGPPPIRCGGPPIVVAGRKRPATRRAARRGDGGCPSGLSPEICRVGERHRLRGR